MRSDLHPASVDFICPEVMVPIDHRKKLGDADNVTVLGDLHLRTLEIK